MDKPPRNQKPQRPSFPALFGQTSLSPGLPYFHTRRGDCTKRVASNVSSELIATLSQCHPHGTTQICYPSVNYPAQQSYSTQVNCQGTFWKILQPIQWTLLTNSPASFFIRVKPIPMDSDGVDRCFTHKDRFFTRNGQLRPPRTPRSALTAV